MSQASWNPAYTASEAYPHQPDGYAPMATATYARPYSRLAEWYLTLCLCYLVFEGMFNHYVGTGLEERRLLIARLTPYNLWPSVMYFYSIGFLVGGAIILMGRRPWHPVYTGMLSLVLLWVVYLGAGGHGFLRGNFSWHSDTRSIILPSVVVPWVAVLVQHVRLDVIAQRLIKIGVPCAILNTVRGVLFFGQHGDTETGGLMTTSWRGEYILLAIYCLAFARSVTAGKRSTLALIILALGIVSTLHKPVLATFLMSNVFLLALTVRAGKHLKSVRLVNTVLVLGALAGAGTFLGPFVLNLGGGYAKQQLLTRIFKYDYRVNERDVYGGRLAMWGWCLEQWADHPVIGTGLGHRIIVRSAENKPRAVPIHNLYMQTLSQTGALGFLLVSAAVVPWLLRMSRTLRLENNASRLWPRLGVSAFVLTMLFASCYGDVIFVRAIGFFFWFCVALESGAHAQTIQEIG